MGSILEDCSKVDFILEKAVDIPGSSPEVEDKQSDPPEHGEYVGHRIYVAII